MINIQKLVTHVTHCLSGVKYLYVCSTAAPGSLKVPGQPGALPVTPTTGIWLRALNELIFFSVLPEDTCKPEPIERSISIPDCIDDFVITYDACRGQCESKSGFRVSGELRGVLEDECQCCKVLRKAKQTLEITCDKDANVGIDKTFTFESAVECKCTSCPEVVH